MDPILVTEIVNAEEAVFEKDEKTGKMTAKVTVIKAGRAKNPRNYRASALKKAVEEGVYNGSRMYVNHSDKPVTKRSPDEMVSAIESTEWDDKKQRIVGAVEFFDEAFFEKAQRAAKYMGVSANHRIAVTKVRENSGQIIEDVHRIDSAHSVDWVVYPSAGGDIISFARESEGVDQVEFSDLTLDQIKEHAPALLEQYKKDEKLVAESEAPKPDPEKEKDDKKETAVAYATPEDVAKIVKEQTDAILKASREENEKRVEAGKKINGQITSSKLPPKIQARLMAQFGDALEYDEKAVKESITEAQDELKEAGVGPRISGMGASGTSSEGGQATVSVKESVEAQFGIGKKKEDPKATTSAASGKES